MNRKELGQKATFAMEKASTTAGWSGAADAFIDTIGEALKRGEKVELRGFGTFSVAQTKPSVGRNPRTGEPMQIPAGRRIRFKPSKTLLD
jgi:DNA-binding protein HU-beta